MQKAKKNLEQSQPQEAQPDEEEALKDLEEAEKDLKDQLEELRRQAEEEKFVQLQQELRKIIESQELVLSKQTRDLDAVKIRKGSLNREEVIRSKSLGKNQDDLGKSLDEIRRKLKESNVDVFIYVLESTVGDMTDAAVNLKEAETGARTQELQNDALRKMKELVDAFDLKRKQNRQQPPPGGGGGGGGGGKPPLVPDLVQLNMMKKIQETLLRKTQGLQNGYKPDRDDLSAGEKTQLQRLSDEQGKLSQLMKTFVSKFEEAKKAYDKKGPKDE
jgi:hypothetical protein